MMYVGPCTFSLGVVVQVARAGFCLIIVGAGNLTGIPTSRDMTWQKELMDQ